MSVAIRVIPCLDVDGGRVVKGVNFTNLRDAGDPVALARAYGEQGADEVTFLDISASADGRATTYEMVTRTAETVFIPLTVGGGVRGTEDVDRLLRCGADKIGINTGAIARPQASPTSPTGSATRSSSSAWTRVGSRDSRPATESPRTGDAARRAWTPSSGCARRSTWGRVRSC